jgi:Ca2+-binding EF-hand superfamily protein
MSRSLPLIVFATACTIAASALARPELPIDLAKAEIEAAQRFQAADTNSDGELNVAEFTAAMASLEGGGHHRFRRFAPHSAPPHGPKAPTAEAPDVGAGAGRREQWRADYEANVFAAMDTDGSGELSASEASDENRDAARRKVMTEAMFERFDADASGTLSAAELPDRVDRLRELDSDGDGLVTESELKAGKSRFAPKG